MRWLIGPTNRTVERGQDGDGFKVRVKYIDGKSEAEAISWLIHDADSLHIITV